MEILTISGSARIDSTNIKLLKAIALLSPQLRFQHYHQLHQLPLFIADADNAPFPESVLEWRKTVKGAGAVIIGTPEYLHNIPALLKNALEWLTSSGELFGKPVLAITFTPHKPRGEKAMLALLNTLNALKARVVGQLALYQNEVSFNEKGEIVNDQIVELLKLAMGQLR